MVAEQGLENLVRESSLLVRKPDFSVYYLNGKYRFPYAASQVGIEPKQLRLLINNHIIKVPGIDHISTHQGLTSEQFNAVITQAREINIEEIKKKKSKKSWSRIVAAAKPEGEYVKVFRSNGCYRADYIIIKISEEFKFSTSTIYKHLIEDLIDLPEREPCDNRAGYTFEEFKVIVDYFEKRYKKKVERDKRKSQISHVRKKRTSSRKDLESKVGIKPLDYHPKDIGPNYEEKDIIIDMKVHPEKFKLSFVADSLNVTLAYLKSIIPKVLGVKPETGFIVDDDIGRLKEFIAKEKKPKKLVQYDSIPDIGNRNATFSYEDIAFIYNSKVSSEDPIKPEYVEQIAENLGIEFINNKVEWSNAEYILQELCANQDIIYADYFVKKRGRKPKEGTVLRQRKQHFYVRDLPSMFNKSIDYVNSKIIELGIELHKRHDKKVINEAGVDVLIHDICKINIHPVVLKERDPERIVTLPELADSEFSKENNLGYGSIYKAIIDLKLPMFWADEQHMHFGISELGTPYIVKYFQNEELRIKLMKAKSHHAIEQHKIKLDPRNPVEGMRSFSFR